MTRCRIIIGLTLVLLGLGPTGCQSGQSVERGSDGSTVNLDELSEAAQAEARQKIMATLSRGVGTYALGVGDEVEVFFNISRRPSPVEYRISPSDTLRIEFLGDKDNSQSVTVRPDGRISLPQIGPVMAAGETAAGLSHVLTQRYGSLLSEPRITVNVTEAHTPLDDFIAVLGASTKGRSIVAKVLPDGTIALPLLPPVPARGRDVAELTLAINAAYSAKGLDVAASVVPRNLHSNGAFVIGEVSKPGHYDLDRPMTVAMIVARAGGISYSGASTSVRIFYIGADGAPRVRSINLDEVMDDFKLADDMIVPPNSIIYVPPTEIAKTGRLVNAIVRDILRFQGYSIGGGYNIQ